MNNSERTGKRKQNMEPPEKDFQGKMPYRPFAPSDWHNKRKERGTLLIYNK